MKLPCPAPHCRSQIKLTDYDIELSEASGEDQFGNRAKDRALLNCRDCGASLELVCTTTVSYSLHRA